MARRGTLVVNPNDWLDEHDSIIAHCPACGFDEAVIHDWQDTLWADGMMEPLPPLDEPEPGELN